MVEMKELQKAVYDNKIKHGWNVTDLNYEFMLMNGEISEAFHSYFHHNKQGFGEELADVAIYLLGIAEITGVDLEKEIVQKIEKNARRVYTRQEDGTYKKEEGKA